MHDINEVGLPLEASPVPSAAVGLSVPMDGATVLDELFSLRILGSRTAGRDR
jgi:hypothetical protein